ncbi:MAG: deoxyribodipyrimidine photo-lyase [Actinobacteria bacterium]|nr:deoxyribodipyrimidine photo-lyase [Actinomycetota bacterium]
MRIAVVLLTRDVRVHDHPALAAACIEADKVVPPFVFDDDIWTAIVRDRTVRRSCSGCCLIWPHRSPSGEPVSWSGAAISSKRRWASFDTESTRLRERLAAVSRR